MITTVEFDVSSRNPPGYKVIPIVIMIKNIMKDMLPITDIFEKFSKKFLGIPFAVFTRSGSDNKIIKYKKKKNYINIVNKIKNIK